MNQLSAVCRQFVALGFPGFRALTRLDARQLRRTGRTAVSD
jgi:hypothetical protein